MPAEIPYMASVANVRDIMSKIQSAGTPPKFTYDFLKSNLGFSSSNDRAIIKILKALGFLTADGTPTARYNEYRGPGGGKALATGLREGWDSFFLSDQKVYQKSSGQIQEIAKNVTGAGDAVATKMASTFKVLADLADFSGPWTESLTRQRRALLTPNKVIKRSRHPRCRNQTRVVALRAEF
jgi:hypothetical protein